MLALCLHKHKNEHIAPIMFPPFSLDPIGFGVVGPMGTFFALSHFTFLRARFAPLSPASVPSFFALASLRSVPLAGSRFLISRFAGLLHLVSTLSLQL